jgi:hypothetical protein
LPFFAVVASRGAMKNQTSMLLISLAPISGKAQGERPKIPHLA